MTGPNRENIRRRFGHAFAFITGKAYVRKADMAESPLGWALGRGIHPCAQQYLPEYGPDFQVHVQTPFNKLNLYTATLTILGEDEPLLHTRFCRTPVEALSNLRIMIMVCEDPDTKSRVARAREENMRRKQERTAKEGSDDPFKEESNEDHFDQRNNGNSGDDEEKAKTTQEDAMREEADLWAQEKLARQQWDFTVRHFAGKKSRLETASRKSKRKTEVATEDL